MIFYIKLRGLTWSLCGHDLRAMEPADLKTLLACHKRLSCPPLHVKPYSECVLKCITRHKYISLPSLVVFCTQCYREFFCGCTNLLYIEIEPTWLIQNLNNEHGSLLLSLKWRGKTRCKHYHKGYPYN